MSSVFDDERKVKLIRLFLISICILIVIFFTYHVTTYVKLKNSLETNIEREKDKYMELSNRIDSVEVLISRIKKDSTFIEKIARENLGMVKPGEKVFKFKKLESLKKEENEK